MDTLLVLAALLLVLFLLTRREHMMFFYGPYIRQTGLDGAVALDQSTVMDVKIPNQPFIYNPTFWRQYPGSYDTCIKQCSRRFMVYPPYDNREVQVKSMIPYCAQQCAMM